MNSKKQIKNQAWGFVDSKGIEVPNTKPIFEDSKKNQLRLFFHPGKFFYIITLKKIKKTKRRIEIFIQSHFVFWILAAVQDQSLLISKKCLALNQKLLE